VPTTPNRVVEVTIKVYLNEIRERLDRAAGIARAAEACADAGNVEKAIEIALDVEQLIPILTLSNPRRPNRGARWT